MHQRSAACTSCAHGRVPARTWQTLAVNVMSEFLDIVGWNIRLRRMAWAMRIKRYLTLATVMASVGTAIGYVIATRNVTDEDRYAEQAE
jgi:hypothetical protein